MQNFTRRKFLKSSLATTVGTGIVSNLASSAWAQIRGANEDIRVGVIGIRGKGAGHIESFHNLDGVRVVALCDVDSDILDREVKKFTDRQEKVDAYIDVRWLLDDKNIDAVVIATPNHWHALITIWACQAGKDVYVEKPVSHNVTEGRRMVEAARKYNRIVQAGSQGRSDESWKEIFEYIRQGNLGEMKLVRGLCYNPRPSIGKVSGPQPIPASIDYNLWSGPAPLTPLRRQSLHYDWHWLWPTGNGDIGNQGAHQMDICRWVTGQDKLPPRVMSLGARIGYDDDANTANTQIAILDYKPVPIIFEVRGLPQKKNIRGMDHYRGVRVGNIIQCEDGYYTGGASGGWLYDNKGNKIKKFTQRGTENHQANFIKAMQSRKAGDLHADILEGHLSGALCHLANISYRLGQRLGPDEIKQTVKDQPHVGEAFTRLQEHLFNNWIDISKTKLTLGPQLEIEPEAEKFVENGQYDISRWANQLLTRNYRKPFVVPDKV